MPSIPVKYPLDTTGIAASNLVLAEPQPLPQTQVRVIVLQYGAFYTAGLVIRDAATGLPLTKDTDYYCTELYETPSMMYGKEICAVIVVTNPSVSANVLVDYQVLGGEFSYSYDAIVQLINQLNLDNRPVSWGSILDKPTAFVPTPHLHDAGDLYGFEYITAAMERIVQAITIGNAAGSDAIYNYIDTQVSVLAAAVDTYQQSSGTSQSVINALGYTPINKGGDTFTGPMEFDGGMAIYSYMKEKVQRISATTTNTVLDLSQATIFFVTMSSPTTFVFDVSKIVGLKANESLSFTLVLVNDPNGSYAAAFPSIVKWSGGIIPPKTSGANSRDEYYFSTFDTGATFTGSLSDEDVK